MPSYKTFEFPVEGGTLHAAMWGDCGPVVVASHGITATHIGWQALADQLGGEFRLIAPDHRGRGRSRDISGPFGMLAHADDLIAIMNHLGFERADLLAGQSMGGFVAAVAAAKYPSRFARVLMIDGGLPVMEKPPPDVSIEQLVNAIIGPSLQRLDMRFESREAYRQFWRAHPSFAGEWSDYVERYVDYDLIGEAPALVSSVSKAAILADVASQVADDLILRSLCALPMPVRFLRAPRGVFNGDALYAQSVLDTWAARIKQFSSTTIADVNHFTIVLSERGAKVVAQEVRKMLDGAAG